MATRRTKATGKKTMRRTAGKQVRRKRPTAARKGKASGAVRAPRVESERRASMVPQTPLARLRLLGTRLLGRVRAMKR